MALLHKPASGSFRSILLCQADSKFTKPSCARYTIVILYRARIDSSVFKAITEPHLLTLVRRPYGSSHDRQNLDHPRGLQNLRIYPRPV